MPRRLPLPEEDTQDGCTGGCCLIMVMFLGGLFGTVLLLAFLSFKN